MDRASRIKLIKAIEKKRNSKVITYITSSRANLTAMIGQDVIPVLHRHILAIPKAKRQKLDLFIYSHGGDSNVPWTLVSMFREYAEKGRFSVLIPYRAHSAATVIALGADEIVMTKKAELGPIDITYRGPYDLTLNKTEPLPISVEDVNGYFSLLKRIGVDDTAGKLQAFQDLVKQVHPLSLGTVNRLLDQTALVAERLLGTRAEPLEQAHIDHIVKQLSAKIYSHSHAINRTEAVNSLRMTQVVRAEDEAIDEDMWTLYEAYSEFFNFETPFMPDEFLIQNQEEEKTWDNIPFACVESTMRSDIYKADFVAKRIPNIPNNISLNVNPIINLGGTNLQQQNQQMFQLIQQAAQQAAIQTVLEIFKKLPTASYAHMLFNAGWKEDQSD